MAALVNNVRLVILDESNFSDIVTYTIFST